mmetsp:Transcript_28881/g.42804  ORF Transcript_28881/g.42804 Transcript_28881/m.42804 type:complete len:619 (-) Transcript_28881:5-1861(-)
MSAEHAQVARAPTAATDTDADAGADAGTSTTSSNSHSSSTDRSETVEPSAAVAAKQSAESPEPTSALTSTSSSEPKSTPTSTSKSVEDSTVAEPKQSELANSSKATREQPGMSTTHATVPPTTGTQPSRAASTASTASPSSDESKPVQQNVAGDKTAPKVDQESHHSNDGPSKSASSDRGSARHSPVASPAPSADDSSSRKRKLASVENPVAKKQPATDASPAATQPTTTATTTKSTTGTSGRKKRPQSSPYRGVTWNKWHQKWTGQIRYDGKQHHLGVFLDPKDAAKAYDVAAMKHHGAKAVLNFPVPIKVREALSAKRQTVTNGKRAQKMQSSSSVPHRGVPQVSNQGLQQQQSSRPVPAYVDHTYRAGWSAPRQTRHTSMPMQPQAQQPRGQQRQQAQQNLNVHGQFHAPSFGQHSPAPGIMASSVGRMNVHAMLLAQQQHYWQNGQLNPQLYQHVAMGQGPYFGSGPYQVAGTMPLSAPMIPSTLRQPQGLMTMPLSSGFAPSASPHAQSQVDVQNYVGHGVGVAATTPGIQRQAALNGSSQLTQRLPQQGGGSAAMTAWDPRYQSVTQKTGHGITSANTMYMPTGHASNRYRAAPMNGNPPNTTNSGSTGPQK